MISEKVLFVDDDPMILESYQRQLRKVLKIETASSAHKGLELVRDWGPFAVVVSDMHMPGMSGVRFFAQVKELSPNTTRIILTGAPDMQVAIDAVNEGSIFRFLTKPCPAEVMGKALVDGINQYRLIRAERDLLEETLSRTIEMLVEILSLTDPDAFGRAIELRGCVKQLAPELKDISFWELDLAATLSQIGHVAVPRELLEKERSGVHLTDGEKNILARIPELGYELLANIPRLEATAQAVRYQGKYYDGSGVPPDAVAGADIPVVARVIRVLTDMLDQESRGVTRPEALRKMEARAGRYDPRILGVAMTTFTSQDAQRSDASGIRVDLADLRSGMVLISDVETKDGRRPIAAGQTISEPMLARIRSYAELVGIKEPIEVRRSPAPQEGQES